MEKLISMREFVLNTLENTAPIDFVKGCDAIYKYAKFLSQPLTLSMFVPTDSEGNVLSEPKCYPNWLQAWGKEEGFEDCELYRIAKENVLFEGFVVTENYGNIVITNGKHSILFSIRNYFKHIESGNRIEVIDDLCKYGILLTKSAEKTTK